MITLNVKQLRYESDSWKRLLSFMTDENIHLKYRVAAILNNGFDKTQLETIENFQTQFIREDALISLLRNEVAELDRKLVADSLDDMETINAIKNKLGSIRKNIIAAENKMAELKVAFNDFILKIL